MTKVSGPIRVNLVRRACTIRKTMPDRRDVLLVAQREFGLAQAPLFVKTLGYNVCVLVTFHDHITKIGGIAHFDLESNVEESFRDVILPAFARLNIPAGRIKTRIIGGQFSSSDNLRRRIRDQLSAPGQRMRIIEIDIIKQGKQGLIIGLEAGHVYDLVQPLEMDQYVLGRLDAATRYLASGGTRLSDVTDYDSLVL